MSSVWCELVGRSGMLTSGSVCGVLMCLWILIQFSVRSEVITSVIVYRVNLWDAHLTSSLPQVCAHLFTTPPRQVNTTQPCAPNSTTQHQW